MPNQKLAATVACSTTNFLIVLTLLGASAILPTIADYFRVSAEVAGWVQTSYLLALTASLLIAGRLGDLFGHRNVYLFGIILFTIVGTLNGFIQDISVLIVLRAVQGIAAALISGNSLAIITNSFSVDERGTAIGIIGMAAAAGGIVGVIISTSLAQYLDWQWMFYLTLPIGLVGIVSARYLRPDSRSEERPRLDYLGSIILALTLIAFSLAFSHLHTGTTTSSAGWQYHSGMAIATVIGFVLFVIVEKRASQPLLQLSYLLNGPFSFSVIANGLLHMTMMSSLFLAPFLLEKGQGLTPSHTAGVIIAISVGSIIGLPISGRIYDRTKWPLFCPLVMVIVCIGLAVMALFAPYWPYTWLVVLSFVLGFTTGFFNTPNNVIVMSAVPANLRGFAAGMLETSRQFGHTLGMTASSAVMSAVLISTVLDASKSAAYITGFQQALLVSSGIAFLGIFAALVDTLTPRKKAVPVPQPAAS